MADSKQYGSNTPGHVYNAIWYQQSYYGTVHMLLSNAVNTYTCEMTFHSH